MGEPYTTFVAPTSSGLKNKSKKLSVYQVLDKLKDFDNLLTELLGERSEWSENQKKNYEELKAAIYCKQYPRNEYLECQYEDGNSRDDDL